MKSNVKDKWRLKTQTAENMKPSGPLSAFAMRKIFFLFYFPLTVYCQPYFSCSNNESESVIFLFAILVSLNLFYMFFFA